MSEHDARRARERREREVTGVSVVWLDEPKPLFETSNVRVWGVATDAEPHLMNTFGAGPQLGGSNDGG